MKKYTFNKLDIEITRKCNKRCVHCMRGDAQDLSMSTEVIDRIFEDVEDVERIVFGNGEPLMEDEKISYFIDKLVESQWSTRRIEVTTNGILFDPRIIEVFEKFCLWKDGGEATLRISNDQYHNVEEYERAYTFYKPLVNAANERIKQTHPYSRIDLHYILGEERRELTDIPGLAYSGRAIELVNNNKEKFIYGKNVIRPFCYKHRIKIIGTKIHCALQISANGNVTFDESASYDQLDDISFGNLLSHSLTDIIDNHNSECLTLCSEAELIERTVNSGLMADLKYCHKDFNALLGIICNGILDLRYRAKDRFSNIPAQTIIERLPFPNAARLYNMVMDMYKHCPYYTENMITNINKYSGTPKGQIYFGAMCSAVLMHLRDKRTPRKYPYWLFGNMEEIDEYLTQLFEDLDLRYEANPEEAHNNKIFLCEPGEHNTIDYSEAIVDESSGYDLQQVQDIITKFIAELEQEKKAGHNESRVL